MKLKVFKRERTTKSESNRIRREGNVPAVLYVRGKSTEAIVVDGAEFSGLLRTVQSGRLSTTIFSLKDEHGKERRAILKEIQYQPTTYQVQHLDFEELFDAFRGGEAVHEVDRPDASLDTGRELVRQRLKLPRLLGLSNRCQTCHGEQG